MVQQRPIQKSVEMPCTHTGVRITQYNTFSKATDGE